MSSRQKKALSSVFMLYPLSAVARSFSSCPSLISLFFSFSLFLFLSRFLCCTHIRGRQCRKGLAAKTTLPSHVSHVWMGQVTYIWMSHVARMYKSCHTQMIELCEKNPHMNESCRKYVNESWHTHMNQSWHTHMNESCIEWIIVCCCSLLHPTWFTEFGADCCSYSVSHLMQFDVSKQIRFVFLLWTILFSSVYPTFCCCWNCFNFTLYHCDTSYSSRLIQFLIGFCLIVSHLIQFGVYNSIRCLQSFVVCCI